MSHFDEAYSAVQAALDAGARYADARVMVRRTESMTARDGTIEDLSSDESAGLGVRALVGSSWGFYAVPDLSDPAARVAGGALARAPPPPPRPAGAAGGGAAAPPPAAGPAPAPPIDLVPTGAAEA